LREVRVVVVMVVGLDQQQVLEVVRSPHSVLRDERQRDDDEQRQRGIDAQEPPPPELAQVRLAPTTYEMRGKGSVEKESGQDKEERDTECALRRDRAEHTVTEVLAGEKSHVRDHDQSCGQRPHAVERGEVLSRVERDRTTVRTRA